MEEIRTFKEELNFEYFVQQFKEGETYHVDIVIAEHGDTYSWHYKRVTPPLYDDVMSYVYETLKKYSALKSLNLTKRRK